LGEVLGLVFPDRGAEALAISADFLSRHPIYHDVLDGQAFVVITDDSGANRVYESEGHSFTSWDGASAIVDSEGGRWTLDETRLQAEDGRVLKRLPAYRAFWFGWVSVFQDTRLVK